MDDDPPARTPSAPADCPCRECHPEAPRDDAERNCLDTVRRFGWQVMLVGAGKRRREPAFAYTVGLPHRAAHPELVVSGLPLDLMHSLLDDVAGRIMGGHRFDVPGQLVEGALARVPVAVEKLNGAGREETVTWSRWFHRGRVPAHQLVWPDTSGVFPWQHDRPESFEDHQPTAWRVPGPRTGTLAPAPDWAMPTPPDAHVLVCPHVVHDGEPVLSVRREVGPGWSFGCGCDGSAAAEQAHLRHVVRSSPSVLALGDLRVGERARRPDPDQPWTRDHA